MYVCMYVCMHVCMYKHCILIVKYNMVNTLYFSCKT